jgi:hypothetical protein
MCHVALIVFRIKHDDAVRIIPEEVRHLGIFHDDYGCRIRRTSMMRKSRAAGGQEQQNKDHRTEEPYFHSPLRNFLPQRPGNLGQVGATVRELAPSGQGLERRVLIAFLKSPKGGTS